MTLVGPPADDSPYMLVGGADTVRALAEAFYDSMEAHEPALAALHKQDPGGGVAKPVRHRFGLFLAGWLGGPQDYMARYGHPRLRMRHARVRVDREMAEAWVRSMTRAMDQLSIEGPVRTFLDARFLETASFLINAED